MSPELILDIEDVEDVNSHNNLLTLKVFLPTGRQA